jgi:hypothetical protein
MVIQEDFGKLMDGAIPFDYPFEIASSTSKNEGAKLLPMVCW